MRSASPAHVSLSSTSSDPSLHLHGPVCARACERKKGGGEGGECDRQKSMMEDHNEFTEEFTAASVSSACGHVECSLYRSIKNNNNK